VFNNFHAVNTAVYSRLRLMLQEKHVRIYAEWRCRTGCM